MKVLELFSADELKEFLENVRILGLYSLQDLEKDIEDIQQQQLPSTCSTIVEFSEKYCDKLMKIRKRKSSYSDGKTLS